MRQEFVQNTMSQNQYYSQKPNNNDIVKKHAHLTTQNYKEKNKLFSIIFFFLKHPVTDKKVAEIFNVHISVNHFKPANEEFQRQTLFFISFSESVTYMAEFGSLADIFPVSPCKYPVSSNDRSYDFFVRNQS